MRLLTIALFASIALANRVHFDDGASSQVCEGMYSRQDWGGSIKPHIGLYLESHDNKKYNKNEDPSFSGQSIRFVIFEYKDLVYLGKEKSVNGVPEIEYICNEEAVRDNLCLADELGNFLFDSDITNTTILSDLLSQLGQANITYPIERTGYYCVLTYSPEITKYKGVVNFQNAFGQLSASEIPKLPAYGILTICYAVALSLYGFQFFKKRKQNQILPLQKYLLFMLSFLTFDTLVVWSYYDLVNGTNGVSWFVSFYMVFLSILNSAKITLSFFLLLCIALGYGVVTLKLSKKIMMKCKILAITHFIASIVFLIGTYITDSASSTSSDDVSNQSAGSLWSLFLIIPVGITMTIYYIMILTSIRQTTANLHKQRQVIKLQLYENLFRIITLSAVLTVGGLTLSSFIVLSLSSTEIVEEHWKGSYFVFDFWPSVVFFGIFLGVSWLWRPTETSYMLAVSQQISTQGEDDEGGETGGYQHGHEFEMDDISVMSHSDDENQRDSFELDHQNIPTESPPSYDLPDAKAKPVADTSNTLFELDDDEGDKEPEAQPSSSELRQ